MPHFDLTRRQALIIGAGAALACSSVARSETAGASFLPASRLGFVVPAGIEPAAEAWRLMSGDQTFGIDIYEQSRLGRDGDAYIWEKDDRSLKVPPSIARENFELREFRDLRYGDSNDYSTRTIVLRDAGWIGQIELSTRTLGPEPAAVGGQIARWKPQIDAIIASIAIRAPLPVADALAELGIGLDAPHLYPRFTGKTLILGLSEPKTASEAWAANGPAIRCTNILQGLRPIDDAERLELGLDVESIISAMKESGRFEEELLEGPHARGMVSKELQFMEGRFSTTLSLFGATRFLDFTAYYGNDTREPMRAALKDVVGLIVI